jgi:hypothetical protein
MKPRGAIFKISSIRPEPVGRLNLLSSSLWLFLPASKQAAPGELAGHGHSPQVGHDLLEQDIDGADLADRKRDLAVDVNLQPVDQGVARRFLHKDSCPSGEWRDDNYDVMEAGGCALMIEARQALSFAPVG